jgi:DNA modification methylase
LSNLKLIQGDLLDVLPTLQEKSVDLCFTSPPYNVNKEYEKILSEEDYIEWTKKWIKAIYPVLKDDGVFVLNIGDKITHIERSTRIPEIWLYCIKELGFHYIENYIWNKQKGLAVKSKYRASNIFEYCLWFSKSLDFTFNIDKVRRPYSPVSLKRMESPIIRRWARERGKDYVDYKAWKPHPLGALPKNILDISSEPSNKTHVAVFPEQLAKWFILAATNEGEIVLDPFLGSGTTMKVCSDLHRDCIGIEINPEYTHIINERTGGMVDI